MDHHRQYRTLQKIIALFCLSLGLGLFSVGLNAQIGIDFNRNNVSGSFNITTDYRTYHSTGNILSQDQGSLHLNINGFMWFNPTLSTRLALGVGLPVIGPHAVSDLASATQALYFYTGEFALRFNLLKTNSVVMILGALMTWIEGHRIHPLLFNEDAQSVYLQTTLGPEFEIGLALGLNYLLYFRLKVPLFSYNSVNNGNLKLSLYPRQGSAELAFLFHKGPSFGLSRAARNVYFGPFYRFDIQVLDLDEPYYIMSHTIGVTYYVKPPF